MAGGEGQTAEVTLRVTRAQSGAVIGGDSSAEEKPWESSLTQAEAASPAAPQAGRGGWRKRGLTQRHFKKQRFLGGFDHSFP